MSNCPSGLSCTKLSPPAREAPSGRGTEVRLFMRGAFTAPAVPAGLSFEVADLILLQGWAEFHQLQLVIELDHCGADGEYEEMVAIYTKSDHLRWLLWRTNEIIVQPLIGRTVHCPSVADAIEILSPQLHYGA